ncbi:MAG: hypothetical protein Q7P63_08930 [Verrucomicrobiota bacterium JB022]|nr:hypothetical protein [Verrucomicrobiota bacterium JB022]
MADFNGMSLEQILAEIRRLPEAEFAQVARSVHAREEEELEGVLRQRSADLSSGKVQGRTHEEVFGNLKRRFS